MKWEWQHSCLGKISSNCVISYNQWFIINEVLFPSVTVVYTVVVYIMLEVIHALNSPIAAQAINLFVCLPSICIYILIIWFLWINLPMMIMYQPNSSDCMQWIILSPNLLINQSVLFIPYLIYKASKLSVFVAIILQCMDSTCWFNLNG